MINDGFTILPVGSLVVIYDPAENRNLYGGGGKAMTDGSWGNHWIRFPQAPFRSVSTIFVNKRVRIEDGSELFGHLNNTLFRNIDYLFTWVEHTFDVETTQHQGGHYLVIDDTEDLEDHLHDSSDIACLQAVSPTDIFLAIEMTEHIPFGSNQLRKIGILDLHAHHGIPTIFVAARSGFRADGIARGPAFKNHVVNHQQNVDLLLPLIESDTPLPNSVFSLAGSVTPQARYLPLKPMVPVGDYLWLDQIQRILCYSKQAPVATFSDFVTSGHMPDGYQMRPSTLQPLLDVIRDAISRAQSGRNVAPSLDPLLAFSNAILHPSGRNRHPPLRNWYLHHGNPPSSTARILPESAFNAADLTHYHGARSGPTKARFELWTASPLDSFESFLNTNRNGHGLRPCSRTKVPYPPNWNNSKGIMCWNPPKAGPLWNENEYMSLYMDFMWCRQINGFMKVSNRDNRKFIFGYTLSSKGDGAYRYAQNVFNAILNQTNVHILEMAWYADFLSLEDGVFIGPQWWNLYGGMAAVAADPNLVRLM